MKKCMSLFLLGVLIGFPMYAQDSHSASQPVEQVWNANSFSSEKSLLENIKEVEELEELLELIIKGDMQALSLSEEKLSVFIPLDSALDKMKRKQRTAFLNKTTAADLKEYWKEYIVPGRLDLYSIKRNIENNNGNPVYIRTLGEKQLEFALKEDALVLRDLHGNEAKLVKGDFYYSQGFFHFIDKLLYIEDI